jgi:2-isopropylmalate synthase
MELPKRVDLYDTTLRDGAQAEGVNFTVEDKIKIARQLDEFGIHYIEGGWPGSNDTDEEFFARAKEIRWKNAKIAAFSMTRRKGIKAEDDPNQQKLLASGAPVITLVGKSWDFHVTHALHVSLDENLHMISDSVRLMKKAGREVVYDAEHFFDGFKANPKYALKTLAAAADAGADILVLCDTNGGNLPNDIAAAIDEVKKNTTLPIGIHCHNDCGVGVANSLIAVERGAVQVQGTMNGIGERCGNANLVPIIANLKLKMGVDCVSDESLSNLTFLSHFVSEMANLSPDERAPFVGRTAFAHKGGMHADAVMKHPSTYEHIDPALIGNERRVLVSEMAGISNVRYLSKELGIDLEKSPEARAIVRDVKKLENEGYEFEGADASFALLVMRHTGKYRKLFEIQEYRVFCEQFDGRESVWATIKMRVNDTEQYRVSEGDGPVHALDGALRLALRPFYPHLTDIKLTDFKVRVVNVREATAAKVRVLIQSSDGQRSWTTIGVSTNIIEASLRALVEGIEYGLLALGE